MGDVLNVFKAIFCFLGGVIGYLLGDFDGFLITLCVFVVTDYITGVIAAGFKHELSSKKGFIGIFKKIIIFVMVAIANIIDVNVLDGPFLRSTVIFFYISNEGVSIIENISVFGVPIPNKIVKVLEQLKNNDEDDVKITESTRQIPPKEESDKNNNDEGV